MKTVFRAAIVLVLGASLFLVGGLGLWDGPSSAPPTGGADVVVTDPSVVLNAPGRSLDAVIASLQERVRSTPGDWEAAASLGLAYVQQARITNDPSLYPKAETVLQASLVERPESNAGAYLGLAALAAARHDFDEALRFGRLAERVNPYDGTVHGVVGDALLELGRYQAAFASFQRMVDIEPGLSAYARVSYARELQGDIASATAGMEAARGVAGTPEGAAFAAYQLGELAWRSGRVEMAARYYREAAGHDPAWAPPQAGLARVAWARGDLQAAIDGYRDVVTVSPLPEHVIALGDLLTLAGDSIGAEQQYALARAQADLLRTGGVNVDLELALFEADHGDPARALAAARAEWDRRHSVHVADALGWALLAAGEPDRAARYARFALSLGTRDASFLYHSGMIEVARGDVVAARRFLRAALATNPNFSFLYGDVARETLRELEPVR